MMYLYTRILFVILIWSALHSKAVGNETDQSDEDDLTTVKLSTEDFTNPPTPVVFEFYRRWHTTSAGTSESPPIMLDNGGTESESDAEDEEASTTKLPTAKSVAFNSIQASEQYSRTPKSILTTNTAVQSVFLNEVADNIEERRWTNATSDTSLSTRTGLMRQSTSTRTQTLTRPLVNETNEQNSATTTKPFFNTTRCSSFYCNPAESVTTTTMPIFLPQINVMRLRVSVVPVNITLGPSNHVSVEQRLEPVANSSSYAEMEKLIWTEFESNFWDVRNANLESRIVTFMDKITSFYKSGNLTSDVIKNLMYKMESILTKSHLLISAMKKFLKPESSPRVPDGSPMRVIGYYTAWGTRIATEKMLSQLTHLIFAFPDMDSTGGLKLNDVAVVRLRQVISLRKKAPQLKVMISVGGWGMADLFTGIVLNETIFTRFTKDLFLLFQKYGLDGVDIDWEYPEGEEERSLFVVLMRKIRSCLESWKSVLGKMQLFLSFAGTASAERIESSFDLDELLNSDIVDWVNVMTYDFYGAWDSPSGIFTGPPAPLFCAVPEFYSRQLNVHWVIQKYQCQVKSSEKIVLGIPFFGRYWNNVGSPTVDDPMWRKVEGNYSSGGLKKFYEINEFIANGFITNFSEQAKASYAWNEKEKIYIGFECPRSVELKVEYANKNKLGGVMIWAVDFDDEHSTMLQKVTSKSHVSELPEIKLQCMDSRWWVATNRSGMCGKMAPLINGFYPVCDPENTQAPCCGKWGYCGSGPEFCDCSTCVDYSKYPDRVTTDSMKPKYDIFWHDMESPSFGLCGLNVTQINGSYAICNPENQEGHCCSSGGFCGAGSDFCECPGCVDFRERPEFRYQKKNITKTWWTWNDGAENAGKCGPDVPKVNDTEATCDPYSPNAFCCSEYGFCGSGPEFCDCATCKNYAKSL